MPEPTVSVVIPCYQSAKSIAACLRAVFAQTHTPHEVIVVDDGSTDGSLEIARGFPCVVLEAERNGGPSAARNRGAAVSTGEILFYLDSDVALEPDAIANAVGWLTAEPDLGCVHGLYTTEPLGGGGFTTRYLLLHNHYWRSRHAGRVATAFFALAAIPKRVYEEIGPFDERLRASEDIEYSERLYPKYGIRLSDRVVGTHDDEITLWAALRKQFRRSQLLVPVTVTQRGYGRGGVRANRFSGVVSAALAVATAPLPLLFGPLWTVLPLAVVLAFTVADPGLSRFVVRRDGARVLARFTALHFAMHLAIVSGALVGTLKMLVDKDFGPARKPRPARMAGP